MIATVPRPRTMTTFVPTVTFEVGPLDSHMHVLIVDTPHHLRVLLDENEHSADGARHLTLAVRENLTQNNWHRSPGGLWTNC